MNTSPSILSGRLSLALVLSWAGLALPSVISGTVVARERNESGPSTLPAPSAVVAWGTDFDPLGWSATLTGRDPYYGQSDYPLDLTNAIGIAGGMWHSLAIKADGTVAAWGDDSPRESPMEHCLQNVIALAGGAGRSLALRSDGSPVITVQPQSLILRLDRPSPTPRSVRRPAQKAAGGRILTLI